MKIINSFCLVFVFLCIACTQTEKTNISHSLNAKPNLQQAKRILFLGDSITYQGGMVVNTELWLKKLYPKQTFELINVGLPSETITGLSEENHANGSFPRPYLHDRLTSILDKTQPDLIIAMYGINCGIYQPYSNQHNMLYQKGYLALHNAITERKIPAVYVTPPMYDHTKGNTTALDYNDKVLGEFTHWLLQNKKHNWNVIDLYKTMNEQLVLARKLDTTFFYQHDGIHMNDEGYWLLSNLIMNYFEPKKMKEQLSLSSLSTHDLTISKANLLAQQLSTNPRELLKLMNKKMHLTRDAWLTFTGHTRPNLAVGLPMGEYKKEVKRLSHEIEKRLDK